MTTAYELEIKAQCPQAEVAYDLFHVVAKYGREVIDRVRADQANQFAILFGERFTAAIC